VNELQSLKGHVRILSITTGYTRFDRSSPWAGCSSESVRAAPLGEVRRV